MNKRNKKYLIHGIIGLVVLLLIGFMMFGSSKENSTRVAPKVLTEKEKYAKFEAQLTCDLADSKSADDIWQSMGKISALAEEYGYTAQNVETFRTEYENDLEFQKTVLEFMREICPEVVSNLGL
jgi:hypothetical protein